MAAGGVRGLALLAGCGAVFAAGFERRRRRVGAIPRRASAIFATFLLSERPPLSRVAAGGRPICGSGATVTTRDGGSACAIIGRRRRRRHASRPDDPRQRRRGRRRRGNAPTPAATVATATAAGAGAGSIRANTASICWQRSQLERCASMACISSIGSVRADHAASRSASTCDVGRADLAERLPEQSIDRIGHRRWHVGVLLHLERSRCTILACLAEARQPAAPKRPWREGGPISSVTSSVPASSTTDRMHSSMAGRRRGPPAAGGATRSARIVARVRVRFRETVPSCSPSIRPMAASVMSCA